MEIRSESLIRHPREVVYLAYRDRLPEICGGYMPDIKEVIIHSREDADGIVKLHNEWVSNADLPKVARAVLKPEHLRWDDYATWNDEGHYVDWVLKTRAFTDAVDCQGRNMFEELEPNLTRVRLTGELKMDLRVMPGVPKLVAKRITPVVEKFIVSMITPNLKKVNESLQTFLDDHA